jgi:dihydrofolate reductase
MAKVLYSVTMSVDGFIAGPGGDMQWLGPYLGPNPEADGLVEAIGALLVGRRAWEGDDPNRGTDREGALEGQWHGPQFVLTSSPPADPLDGVTFVDDPARAVALASAAAGERYVNVLGASAARACLEIDRLDEVLVFVAPVMLGGGTRLFDRPDGEPVRLERISVGQAPLATSLWFRVLR